jgi:DinB superfamily
MHTHESVQIRGRLVDAMRGHQAHIDLDSALENFPVEFRGAKVQGAPHTAWQLLEHMRLALDDILEFSRDANHESPEWPEGYWPKADAPPNPKAWDESLAKFRRDSNEMNKLVSDLQNNLLEPFEHGDGQDLLREALLVASHNSYHLGQLVFLRKILEAEAKTRKDDTQDTPVVERLKRQSLLDMISDERK